MKKIALALALFAATHVQAQKPAQDTTKPAPPKQYSITLQLEGWNEMMGRIGSYKDNIGNADITTADQSRLRKDAYDLLLFIKQSIEGQMKQDTIPATSGGSHGTGGKK